MISPEIECAAEFIRGSIATDSTNGRLQGTHLVEAIEQRVRRKAAIRRFAAGAASALLVVGAFAATRGQKSQSLTYRVGTSDSVGVVGSYVSAPQGKPLDLHFSEGSQVIFQPLARGRVAGTTSRGATMILEDGRAHADIVHRSGTDWHILAGPYVVGVTGTSFEVSYDVSTQTFELDMRSGVVKVSGPGLVNPVEVRNSQRFVLSAISSDSLRDSGSNLSVKSSDAAGESSVESPKGSTSVASEEELLRPTAGKSMPARDSALTNSATIESWSRLGAKGQHRRIVELAEKQGLDTATATASGPDLFALGNAARYAGKAALAAKAYRALRERFSNSIEASGAAFFLGRISESSDPVQAMSWYDRYVAEAPSGVWVADALGRRMVTLNNAKGSTAAEAAARDYLERFPTGPYAGFARKMLGL